MSQPLNILMLGGAKRVSMARHFIAVAADMGFDAHIFSFELIPDVPIAAVGKVIIGGRWTDPDVLDQLHKACVDNDIHIIIPFVDGAVEIAARYCLTSDKVWSPVSTPGACRAMFDKVEADKLWRESDIPLPCAYRNSNPASFPVIAKPRTGSASKGILIIENEAEWQSLHIDTNRYIIQEYIRNKREYTLDCYVDRNGAIHAISPRQRIEVVGGEVSRTVSVELPKGESIARRAIACSSLRGAITIQLIEDVDTDRLMLMEINPRLGGGAVCSIYAGINLPAMIINDYLGNYSVDTEINVKTPVPGIEMTRYMQEVVFSPDNSVMQLPI